MKIILDTDNIFEYLDTLNYCNKEEKNTSKITIINAKNFNLYISFKDGKNLLIKQEIHDFTGEAMGEFWTVWRSHELINYIPDFGSKFRDLFSELLHFDPENSILIFNYSIDYQDLFHFYIEEQQFPDSIARLIGQYLGSIHSYTFQNIDCQKFLEQPYSIKVNTKIDDVPPLERKQIKPYSVVDIIERISRITPDIFQAMPQECLQFFKLYQRFPVLSQAISDLKYSVTPSCLVHNDLKLNNILLSLNWEVLESGAIKLIDWEKASWGDPAFDVGCILCSYLEIWLDGLTINNALSINESLQLANTPLEQLQPSLSSLIESYIEVFPDIMLARPDYLNRVIQFAGLALIERIEITIDEERTFGNRGIVMLQVAKQLICTPQAAMNTVFGNSFTQSIYQ